ncbi:MAG: TIGR04551 family protein, partial [Polyangiaceae bacterium]
MAPPSAIPPVSSAIPSPASAPQEPSQRSIAGDIAANGQEEVFSDDWWGRVRPVVGLHGYFRTRAELFQNLALGRHGTSLQGSDPQYLAPLPLDQSYLGTKNNGVNVALCGDGGNQICHDETMSGANMRLRLDPEIDISDNLRIVSEIFALDNVVLGSTPDAYAMAPSQAPATPSAASGVRKPAYQSAGYNPYAPVGFFSSTQGPPTAGINSYENSINVQRVWGEYM